MTEHAQAWLLRPVGAAFCAVADHEIMQYLNGPTLYAAPFALPHCCTATVWQGQLVPVLSLGPLTGDDAPIRDIVVLAYQSSAGEPLDYIGLAVRTGPVKISVADDAACALPERHQDLWQTVAKSCFTHAMEPAPILDIERLCSAEFRDFAAQRLADVPQPTLSASPASISVTAMSSDAACITSLVAPAPPAEDDEGPGDELSEDELLDDDDLEEDLSDDDLDDADLDDGADLEEDLFDDDLDDTDLDDDDDLEEDLSDDDLDDGADLEKDLSDDDLSDDDLDDDGLDEDMRSDDEWLKPGDSRPS